MRLSGYILVFLQLSVDILPIVGLFLNEMSEVFEGDDDDFNKEEVKDNLLVPTSFVYLVNLITLDLIRVTILLVSLNYILPMILVCILRDLIWVQ